MLQELMIHNFAIIDNLDLAFKPKMTVLTGETGAGKSIIIDALGLLAGGRGSSDFVRKGENKASIQGLFEVPQNAKTVDILTDLGIDYEADGLILQRHLYRSGKNVCRINGNLVNLASLRRVGETLIDIHGQNEHQSLMHPENHLDLLDHFDKSLQEDLDQYHSYYHDYQTKKQALNLRKENEKQWAQRLDMLQFQVKEIAAAKLVDGEEEALRTEKEQLDNYQAIHAALENGYEALNGGSPDLMGVLGGMMDDLGKVASINAHLQDIYTKISDAFYGLQDAGYDISNELDSMEWDEGRLDNIEARLEMIHQLKRKYGDSIAQILAYYQKITQELDSMQDTELDAKQQEEAVALAYKKALEQAKILATKRHKIAQKLEQEIHVQLSELYMDKALFKVKFTPCDLNAQGMERVEFYIQTNLGEEMGPLAKIASGGELSRIMLALKTIFAQNKGVTSIIFDEVDTGVSGRVAQAIAEKISLIAQHSQVLCITHLPQVAAIADNHYFIYKKVVSQRTETQVVVLDENKRINEIARMLSGSTITELTLEHAKELLAMAQKA